MIEPPVPEPPRRPEDLSDFFLERANAADVEGVVALYEPDAVLAFPPGQLAVGHKQIRAVYAEFLADRPVLGSAGQRQAIVHGDIALTSTLLPGGGATAEIARPATGRHVALGHRSALGPAITGNSGRHQAST